VGVWVWVWCVGVWCVLSTSESFQEFSWFLTAGFSLLSAENSLILDFLQEMQTQRHSQRAELKHVIALTKACHSTTDSAALCEKSSATGAFGWI
jgi:hypothetical protein